MPGVSPVMRPEGEELQAIPWPGAEALLQKVEENVGNSFCLFLLKWLLSSMTDFKKPKAAPGRPQSGLTKLIPHTGPSSGSPSQGQGTLNLTWARQSPTSYFWNIGVSISGLEPGTERQHSNKTYEAGWEASMHNPPLWCPGSSQAAILLGRPKRAPNLRYISQQRHLDA